LGRFVREIVYYILEIISKVKRSDSVSQPLSRTSTMDSQSRRGDAIDFTKGARIPDPTRVSYPEMSSDSSSTKLADDECPSPMRRVPSPPMQHVSKTAAAPSPAAEKKAKPFNFEIVVLGLEAVVPRNTSSIECSALLTKKAVIKNVAGLTVGKYVLTLIFSSSLSFHFFKLSSFFSFFDNDNLN